MGRMPMAELRRAAGLALAFGGWMRTSAAPGRAPIGPAFAASHLEIVSVTLFSVAFLGDRLSALQALGCCAIVSGVIVLAATESGS